MNILNILWHEAESAGYTDQIPLDWLEKEGALQGMVHDVVGPRGGKYKAKCDVSVTSNVMDFDYTHYEDFNERHEMYIGVMRVHFTDPTRTHVSQVLWKWKGEDGFSPCSTTITFSGTAQQDFDSLVAEAARSTSQERLKRLAVAPKQPIRKLVISTLYERNPDVVAEVLYRANGRCELCKEPAPFKRATDGTLYLEVHHTTPLAAGGADTVENAIAVCPNCHRRAHFG